MKFLWLFAAVLCPFSLHAQWPEFRGPDANGTIAKSALPTEWSEEKNVSWKVDIHGLGWSTPIISEGKIWLTTATEGFDFAEFQEKVLALPEVESLHHPHSWSLDGEEHVLTMHIVRNSDPAEDVHLKNKIRSILAGGGFSHITLEMEAQGEDELEVEQVADKQS
jgi:hypothetical protein